MLIRIRVKVKDGYPEAGKRGVIFSHPKPGKPMAVVLMDGEDAPDLWAWKVLDIIGPAPVADGKNYLPCVRCGATLHVVLNADKPCPVCGKRRWKQTGIHIPSGAGDIRITYPVDVDVEELVAVLHQTANSLPAMEDFQRQLGTKKEGES